MRRSNIEPSPIVRVLLPLLIVGMALYWLAVAVLFANFYMAGMSILLTGTAAVAWGMQRVPDDESQVWLGGRGYGWRRGPGRLKIRPWRNEEIDFHKRREGAYWFVIRRTFSRPVQLFMRLTDEEAAALRARVETITGHKVRLNR
ncbi:MAG TPA: hypothetical protein VH253_13050 [Phycisphaerae bacterium]|nr:hypothetical protein [Phycisphaerae bacterium]